MTIWRAVKKRSQESMYKTNIKNKARRLRALTIAITKCGRKDQYCDSKLTKCRILGAPIIYICSTQNWV